MTVRSYRFLSSAQKRHLHNVFLTALSSWYNEWFGVTLQDNDIALCSPIKDMPCETIRLYQSSNGEWVALHFNQTIVYALFMRMFGIDGDYRMGPISCDLVDELLRDLAQMILASEVAKEITYDHEQLREILPRTAFHRASASAYIAFPWENQTIGIYISPHIVDAQLAKPPQSRPRFSLVDIKSALSGRKAHVSVSLGTAEIPTCDLLSLSVGDVIRIEKNLASPLAIKVEGVNRLHGYLARTLDSHKCLRIVNG